jgi:ubiquinone/menaquinone biosynthesis C-methylase UbiE
MEAWALQRFTGLYNRRTAETKGRLLGPLRGRVLEIASGTGGNLGFYAREVEWTGVDVNPHSHGYAAREAVRVGVRARCCLAPAERLPFAAGEFDAVVSTLALCSVRDPEQVLAEVGRVLRAGGRLVFLEHVAAERDSPHRRVQERAAPFFRCCLGCNPRLETERLIRRAGFTEGAIESLRVDLPVVRPHIAGSVGR